MIPKHRQQSSRYSPPGGREKTLVKASKNTKQKPFWKEQANVAKNQRFKVESLAFIVRGNLHLRTLLWYKQAGNMNQRRKAWEQDEQAKVFVWV